MNICDGSFRPSHCFVVVERVDRYSYSTWEQHLEKTLDDLIEITAITSSWENSAIWTVFLVKKDKRTLFAEYHPMRGKHELIHEAPKGHFLGIPSLKELSCSKISRDPDLRVLTKAWLHFRGDPQLMRLANLKLRFHWIATVVQVARNLVDTKF